MRILATLCLVAAALSAVTKADAAPASKAAGGQTAPARRATKPFTLTQALAVLQACPEARFDSASIIALGGVLRENKATLDAAPVEKRMELMNQLVTRENASAEQYRQTHKVDCAKDAQQAAGYWNRMLESIAADQQVAAPQIAPVKPAQPAPERGVAGTRLQLP